MPLVGQGENPPLSSLHSKLDPGSFDAYVNDALELSLGSGGAETIVVWGGVMSLSELSTIQVNVAAAPWLAALSLALTEKVYSPLLSFT